MADKKLNIKVRTDGAKRAKKDLKGVEGGMKSLGKAAAVAGAAFFAARGLIAGFQKVINLSAEQELAEKKLEAALGQTSKALLAQASALQQVSMFGDEQIIEAQALIAAFVDEEEAIAKATQATLDLAAAKGMDLTAAADLVSKTLGSSTNAMSRYGIEVNGAVGSTERLDSLVGNIADKFGGQAKAQTDTMAGSLNLMKKAAGDAGEALGDILAPVVVSVANALKGAFEWAESFLDGLNNLVKFGNVVGKIDSDTKEALEARVAANKQIINDLIIQQRWKGGLNEHEQESLEMARHFLGIDEQKLAVLLQIEAVEKKEEERQRRIKEISENYLKVQKQLAEKAEQEKAIRERVAQFAAQTSASLLTSAIMGDNITDSLKRAAIQLGIMVAQAKIYAAIMDATKGMSFLSGGGILSGIKFLFGASPTQIAPSAHTAASNITTTVNITGGVIDQDIATNQIIPAINKAISTGQARIG